MQAWFTAAVPSFTIPELFRTYVREYRRTSDMGSSRKVSAILRTSSAGRGSVVQ